MSEAIQKTSGMSMELMTPREVVDQIALIQNLMQTAMQKDQHYGVIPGCGNKPTLLKAGAEKLGLMFRLAPEFRGADAPIDLGNGHREYIINCRLRNIVTGDLWGEGVGSCSTMESKYRFRTGPTEGTGKVVPKEYWTLRKTDPKGAQELIGGPGFSTKKVDGVWQIIIQGEKVENENPADQYNTVLKVAKKRAHIDAMITATAASDIFTQDIEELRDNGLIESEPVREPIKEPEKISQEQKKSSSKDSWFLNATNLKNQIIKHSSEEKFIEELGSLGFTSLEEVPEANRKDVTNALANLINELIK